MNGKLEGLLAHFCDDFCRFPLEADSQDRLDAVCELCCPLVELISQLDSQPELEGEDK